MVTELRQGICFWLPFNYMAMLMLALLVRGTTRLRQDRQTDRQTDRRNTQTQTQTYTHTDTHSMQSVHHSPVQHMTGTLLHGAQQGHRAVTWLTSSLSLSSGRLATASTMWTLCSKGLVTAR